MIHTAKKKVQNVARSFGYDIVHRTRTPPGDLDTLQHRNFKTILDVGANSGQFAGRIRAMYPTAEIHSFEPLAEPFRALVQNFESDLNFYAYCLAMGEKSGQADFFENGLDQFSSALPMNAQCREDFPMVLEERRTRVEMTSLDEWARTRVLARPLLLKIDVQGYEDRVIRGGIQILKRASVVITEITFRPLYESQLLFHDVYELLRSCGFTLTGVVNNTYDISRTKIDQADAIFENTNSALRP
jgi:FkbM family methyltransferase